VTGEHGGTELTGRRTTGEPADVVEVLGTCISPFFCRPRSMIPRTSTSMDGIASVVGADRGRVGPNFDTAFVDGFAVVLGGAVADGPVGAVSVPEAAGSGLTVEDVAGLLAAGAVGVPVSVADAAGCACAASGAVGPDPPPFSPDRISTPPAISRTTATTAAMMPR
jgi:hypothetical protein